MSIPQVIAIDGPASSGKSTLGERLARTLGYLYLDTGVMYRAVTWVALIQLGEVHDESAVTKLAQVIRIDVRPATVSDGRKADVLVDDVDVTWEIREKIVDANVSEVSAYRGVREEMTEQQRRIASRGKIVMVGRDIGTVVLPDADLKIYLDASVEERARRRYLEIVSRGGEAELDQILSALEKRDLIDSTRALAPLKIAEDAIVIDSDPFSADEVFNEVLKLIYAHSD